jgi:hypothetical protein
MEVPRAGIFYSEVLAIQCFGISLYWEKRHRGGLSFGAIKFLKDWTFSLRKSGA